MERHDRGQDLVMVASEPLTFERGDWVTVPTNSVLTINRQTVLIHPIIGLSLSVLNTYHSVLCKLQC
jgi:glutamine amidotransferase